ncbi:MAG: hypothetical protein IH991_19270, partial [Planctomycetes bacterium]|nr:hypothetical protein [Planctomycetota bacterium]
MNFNLRTILGPLCYEGGIALIVMLAAMQASMVCAERPSPAGFQPIQLKYAEPNEVAMELRRALPHAAQILVDQHHNRVLVQGGLEDLRIARAVVRNLDLPRNSKTERANLQQRTVRTFNGNPNQVELIAARLRNQFLNQDNVHVSSNPRIGQLLVLAPNELQPAIAEQLLAQGLSPANPKSRPSTSNKNQPVTRRLVQLRHVTWREFEEAVKRIWGNQITLVTQGNGEVTEARFASPENASVQLQIDRRRNQVYLEAPENLVDAWEKAISAIDQPASREREKSALVQLGKADPAMVRRAILQLQSADGSTAPDESRAAVPVGRNGRNSPVGRLAAMLFQAPAAGGQAPAVQPENQPGAIADDDTSGLFGNVKIQFLEGLDIVI